MLAALAEEAEPHGLAVPAEFIRYIRIPGQGEQILRPSVVHYDRFHDEVLVGDSGHNRVVIFSSAGAYKFEFSLTETMTFPRDLTTNSEGYIFIAGSDPSGPQIRKFDFDGLPLESLLLPIGDDGEVGSIQSMAVGPDDQLYCLDQNAGLIHVFNKHSVFLRSFPIVLNPDSTPDQTTGAVLGSLALVDDELLLPVSSVGTVVRMDTSGRYLGSVGYFGAKPGTLNFPVAVEVSPEGLYLVLDKGRFCVVCFDANGAVLGEFGGKGLNPGWFIGPSLLAVPSAGSVLVGQIFQNKIQACSIPGFIRLGNSPSHSRAASEAATLAKLAPGGNERRSASILSNNAER